MLPYLDECHCLIAFRWFLQTRPVLVDATNLIVTNNKHPIFFDESINDFVYF